MIMFIDDHREHLGVEAICKVLPIAPSTYYHHKSIELNPEKASARAKRDAFIMTRITHFWEKSRKRYGAVKIWHDLLDEGTERWSRKFGPGVKVDRIAKETIRNGKEKDAYA
jgi:putative transposase